MDPWSALLFSNHPLNHSSVGDDDDGGGRLRCVFPRLITEHKSLCYALIVDGKLNPQKCTFIALLLRPSQTEANSYALKRSMYDMTR